MPLPLLSNFLNLFGQPGVATSKALALQELALVRKQNTGVMVALMLETSVAQTIYDFCLSAGIPADDLVPVKDSHITLVNLGDSVELAQEKYRSPRDYADSLEYFSRYQLPVVGTTTGIGLFDPITSDDGEITYPLVVFFDSPQLPEMREELVGYLEDSCYLRPSRKHGYLAHITVGYFKKAEALANLLKLAELPKQSFYFDKLTLAWGDARFDLPLLGESKQDLIPTHNYDYESISYPAYKAGSSCLIVKQVNGKWRFFAFTSSSFEDGDGEWAMQKALTLDCLRAEYEDNYGPLLWWHEPQLVLGECDYNDMYENILVESGIFKSERIAKAMQVLGPDLGMSLGFGGWRDKGFPRAFYKMRKVERSALWEPIASNRVTAFAAVNFNFEEVTKAMSMQNKLQSLVNKLKENGYSEAEAKAVADEIAGEADNRIKEAQAAGLTTKTLTLQSPVAAMEPATATAPVAIPPQTQPNPAGISITMDQLNSTLTAFQAGVLKAVGQLVDQKLVATSQETVTKETQLTTVLGQMTDALKQNGAAVAALQTQLKELKGEAPAAVNNSAAPFGAGTRPSESTANLISADLVEIMKQYSADSVDNPYEPQSQYASVAGNLLAGIRGGFIPRQ